MAYGDEGYGRGSDGASTLNATTGAAIAALGLATLGAAVRSSWLTRSGAVAAALVGGAIAVGLELPGLAMLTFFFVSSSWLTRASRRALAHTADRASGAVDDPGAQSPGLDTDATGRSAGQVLANAGVATFGALIAWSGWAGIGGPLAAATLAAGALAAATADTWSSEIGQRVGGRTRLITTGVLVDPGVNGGVSWVGTAAGMAGSAALGAVAAATLGEPGLWLPITAAGTVGMLVDSVIGATAEDRLELANDFVNLAGTLAGGLAAIAIA